MPSPPRPASTRDRVRAHRERLRRQGLRPVQIWVPDTRSPRFTEEAHRQSLAVALSAHADEEQAAIEGMTDMASDAADWRRMKRGEIWTVASSEDGASTPRFVAIVQDDGFDATGSVTVCAFTTDPAEAPHFRVEVQPTEANGLDVPARLMVDKITTVRRSRLETRLGRVEDTDLRRLTEALVVFLGVAGART